MLNKLIKHELRASGRIMLPFLAGVVILSLLTGLWTRIMETQLDYSWVTGIFGLIIFFFAAGVLAVCVLSIVVMVRRFQKNLLSDEGYISFTLPVSVDEHILSKLITSFIWFAATALICLLAIFVPVLIISRGVMFDSSITVDLFGEEGVFPYLVSEIGIGNIISYLLEMLVIAFFASCATCLHFYLAMAIGYGFDNHKGLLSVVFFFVLSSVMNSLAVLLMSSNGNGSALFNIDYASLWSSNSSIAVHTALLCFLATQILSCAVYYIPTRFLLKNRLNLP